MSTYGSSTIDREMAKRRAARKKREEDKRQKEEEDLKAYNAAVEAARAERVAKENPQPEKKVEPKKPKRKSGGDRGKSRTPMYLWIYASRDEYELPMIVEDTAKELARRLGVSQDCVLSSPCNSKRRGNDTRIKAVEYLRDNDEFYRWFCGIDDDCDCCCCACKR